MKLILPSWIRKCCKGYKNNIFQCWKYALQTKCPLFVIFRKYQNCRSDGTKRCVDLIAVSTYSSCKNVHHKLPYNKISIVMSLFHSFGIPKILIIILFRKLDPFQVFLIHDSDESLLFLALCWQNHIYVSSGHLILEIDTWIVCWMRCIVCYFYVSCKWMDVNPRSRDTQVSLRGQF